MLQDAPELDTLVVPVGGGGMIAGCAVAARGLKPDIKVIGVESAGYSAMRQLLAGEPVTAGGDTIAEGIAVRDIGTLPLRSAATLLDRVRAGRRGRDRARHRPAARGREDGGRGRGRGRPRRAARHPELFTGRKVGLVLCGGNIDTRLLPPCCCAAWCATAGSSACASAITDGPASSPASPAIIGKAGGNIVEVVHQRAFSELSVKATDLDVTVETRGAAHADAITGALAGAGFAVQALGTDDGSGP